MDGREAAWARAMDDGRRGDGAAYARLLGEVAASLRPIVRAKLRRLGLGDGDSEDVVQEVLIALHTKRHTWDPSRPFVPWCRAIARHKLVDTVRRLSREARRSRDVADGEWDALFEAPLTDPDRGTIDVETIIGTLPGRQRDVLDALVVEGASVKIVAARLQTSEGVVRMTFHRALDSVRRALERGHGNALEERT